MRRLTFATPDSEPMTLRFTRLSPYETQTLLRRVAAVVRLGATVEMRQNAEGEAEEMRVELRSWPETKREVDQLAYAMVAHGAWMSRGVRAWLDRRMVR